MPSIDARLHDGALVRREGARHQQVAVGAERLVGLLQLVQLRVVLLAAPMIEVAEEAARLLRLPGRPGGRRRQAVEQRKAGDRDEALLAACALRHHGVEGGDLLFARRRGGRFPSSWRRYRRRRCLHVGRRHDRAPLWRATQGGMPPPRTAPITAARRGFSRVEVLGLSRLAGRCRQISGALWRRSPVAAAKPLKWCCNLLILCVDNAARAPQSCPCSP